MYVLRFRDTFGNSLIDTPLVSDPGNGSIAETTYIQFTAPAATQCRWDASGQGAPLAYLKNLSPIGVNGPANQRRGLMRFVARLHMTSFTSPDDAPRTGLTIFGDRNNAYQLSYDLSSEYVEWQRIVSGTVTNIANSGGNTGNPNVTPKRFQMYWNPREYQLQTPHGHVLTAGQIAAYWSDTDGASWTYLSIESFALDVRITGAGVYLKRSVNSPTSQATSRFSLLEVYEEADPDPIFLKDDTAAFEDAHPRFTRIRTAGVSPKHTMADGQSFGQPMPGPITQDPQTRVGPTDTSAYEDAYRLRSAGGPVQHTSQLPMGQAMPGPAEGTAQGRTGPDEQTAFEDRCSWVDSGGPQHHSAGFETGVILTSDNPMAPEGGVRDHEPAAFEDKLLYSFDPEVDYYAEKNDTEGHAFLGGHDATRIMLYDTTGEPWASAQSAGNGFYGAAIDGTLYYDGEACGVGIFGDVSSGVRRKSWACNGNGPLNHGLFSGTSAITFPSSDHARIKADITAAWTYGVDLTSAHRWYLEGDFDIQVSFENYSKTGSPSDGGASIAVYVAPNTLSFIRRHPNNVYDRNTCVNGSWGASANVGTTHTAGRLRLTRSGSSISHYYWTGSAWAQLGGAQTMTADRVFVVIDVNANAACVINIDWFGFTVNSGTVSNKIGWARETAGAHRSATSAFPAKALLVSTALSFDILDANNEKLWMRFLKGTNYGINPWNSGNERPLRPDALDGVIMLSQSDGGSYGGSLVLDFTLDSIRMHRGLGSSYTGCLRTKPTGSVCYARDYSKGDMINRNAANGFGGDYNNWRIPGESVQDVALLHYSGYQYRAHATQDGVGLHKWRRWWHEGTVAPDGVDIPQWAASNELTTMYWCYFRPSTRELMYLDDYTLYAVLEATYEIRLGGGFGNMWSADYARALPGTFTWNSQKVAIPFGVNTFFIAMNEGIYSVDWPIGGFVKKYGVPGSGADYEILPAGMRPKAICLTQDSGNWILVVNMVTPDNSQAQNIAINLGTHAVYARTKVYTFASNAGELAA